jgi:hypothetical protein
MEDLVHAYVRVTPRKGLDAHDRRMANSGFSHNHTSRFLRLQSSLSPME